MDPLTEHTDPNQRCTCGWKRFREISISEEESTTRWVLYDTGTPGGFGASEFGTYFGAGTSGAYGEFETTLRSCSAEVRCENCTRLRLNKLVSSSTIFGAYVQGSDFYVVTGGVLDAGCFTIEWRGPTTLTSFLKISSDPQASLLISDTPIQGPLPSPPAGAAVADVLLKTSLPQVPIAGDYEAVLVNSCCGFEIPLGTVSLEVDVVVLIPTDAELSAWQPFEVGSSGYPLFPPQPGGIGKGIPFDYCSAVIEYDSRFVTLPDAQGWTHVAGGGGSGDPEDWALAPGNVLVGSTPGSANPSYWEQVFPFPSAPADSVIYGHSEYLFEGAGTHVGDGEGLDFQALHGIDTFAFSGVRWTSEFGDLYGTGLDGTSETLYTLANQAEGYSRAGGFSAGLGAETLNHNNTQDDTFTLGTVGTASGDQLVARFGDVVGEGVSDARVRAFHISHPGRFLRAWFRTYTTVASPVLRLYLVSDADASGETSARFKVRYGPALPNVVPALTAEATVNFMAHNVPFEVPLNLPNLTPNTPLWFTVERDWVHADNRTEATVWLMQATLRGA